MKQATSLCFCSVKHEYEKPFQPENPQITTCNEATKQFAANLQMPQEVNESDEILFTYDVKFQVKVLHYAHVFRTRF
jgi:transmembrane 9 superfamily protein 2/4